jgi:hypothetical protein
MAALTFLEVLKAETMKFQAAHPDREGEIARASALITLGMVTPSPDDAETGRVLSSDGHKVYHVNGQCSCDAGQHGRHCKHVSGWKLYQHVQRKVEAQTAPEVVVVDHNNSPLYEAPVSITLKASVHGFETLVTLRGTDFASVQAQVEQAAQWLKAQAPQPAPQASSPGQDGFCQKQQVTMTLNTKNSHSWYSHRLPEGGFCKGR